MEILSIKHNSPEWYELRKSGIGGSDAAAILGISPWKTNVDLSRFSRIYRTYK